MIYCNLFCPCYSSNTKRCKAFKNSSEILPYATEFQASPLLFRTTPATDHTLHCIHTLCSNVVINLSYAGNWSGHWKARDNEFFFAGDTTVWVGHKSLALSQHSRSYIVWTFFEVGCNGGGCSRQSVAVCVCLSYRRGAGVCTACAVATNRCISDVPCQWDGQNFDPHSSHIFQPIFLKLKTNKGIRSTPHAKLGWVEVRRRDVGLRILAYFWFFPFYAPQLYRHFGRYCWGAY